jgi:hypothetical protein
LAKIRKGKLNTTNPAGNLGSPGGLAEASGQLVTTIRLKVRAEPDTAGRLLCTLEPRTAITIPERRSDWTRLSSSL